MKTSIVIEENKSELHPEVQRLYNMYKEEMGFWSPNAEYDPDDRRFYVYAWFTKDAEKKVFYVGKGTGDRVKHILTEIRLYEENTAKYKGQRYKELRDKFGIDYEILINNITDYEAEIYEYCMMREYTKQGEVLLNFVDMPLDYEELKDTNTDIHPEISVDRYYKRYFGCTCNPQFDKVEIDKLLYAYFYGNWKTKTKSHFAEKERIKQWIQASGGKVYASIGKGTKCVIVQGNYPYEHFLNDHLHNRVVYSATDVFEFLRSQTPMEEKQLKTVISIPRYNIKKRDEMRQFLVENLSKINGFIKTSGDGYEEEIKGIELKKEGKDEEALIQFCISIGKGADFPALYNQTGIVLRKYGLFDEEILVLEAGIKNIRYDEARSGIIDRYNTAVQIRNRELEIQEKKEAKEQRKCQKAVETTKNAEKVHKATGKAILQMDDTMNIIQRYETISEAVRSTGINSKSIRDAAKGVQKHAGGFVWKYADEEKR